MGRIRDKIKQSGISVSKIAKKLGVSRQTVYDWDRDDFEENYKIIIRNDSAEKRDTFPL